MVCALNAGLGEDPPVISSVTHQDGRHLGVQALEIGGRGSQEYRTLQPMRSHCVLAVLPSVQGCGSHLALPCSAPIGQRCCYLPLKADIVV